MNDAEKTEREAIKNKLTEMGVDFVPQESTGTLRKRLLEAEASEAEAEEVTTDKKSAPKKVDTVPVKTDKTPKLQPFSSKGAGFKKRTGKNTGRVVSQEYLTDDVKKQLSRGDIKVVISGNRYAKGDPVVFFNLNEYRIPYGIPVWMPIGLVEMLKNKKTTVRTRGAGDYAELRKAGYKNISADPTKPIFLVPDYIISIIE